MARSTRISIAAANLEADALATALNGGTIRIYTGTQPDNPEDTATGTLLAECTFDDPAFGSASGGIITANAITAEDSALADGDAGWFRALTSADDAMFDGSAGAEDCDLILSRKDIQTGDTVEIESLTHTVERVAIAAEDVTLIDGGAPNTTFP